MLCNHQACRVQCRSIDVCSLYLDSINHQATIATLNFLWTIPYKELGCGSGFRTTDQSYLSSNPLRRSPCDSNNLASIVSSFPCPLDIITPSWYCSQVFVAVNRYHPLTFNQLYLDNKNRTDIRWQVQNSGGISAGDHYWFYWTIGSGIWAEFQCTLRAMNKVHAIYRHLLSESCGSCGNRCCVLRETLDRLLVYTSADQLVDNMRHMLTGQRNTGSIATDDVTYFNLTDTQWEQFKHAMSDRWDPAEPMTNDSVVLGILDILTDEKTGTTQCPVTDKNVYYAQELNNLGKFGDQNPVDPALRQVAGHYDAVIMYANWNSSALWTTEILHTPPDGQTPPTLYRCNAPSATTLCSPCDEGFNPSHPCCPCSCGSTPAPGSWSYLWSDDVPASNYRGQGTIAYQAHCS